MLIGVPRETAPGEHRVSLTPDTVGRLAKGGLQVIVESGAGVPAALPDADYTAAGARVADAAAVYAEADVVVRVAAGRSRRRPRDPARCWSDSCGRCRTASW